MDQNHMLNLARNRAFLIGVVALIALIGAVIVELPVLVKAATSYVSVQTTAVATTTVSYITAGTATTTYQFDGLAAGKVQEMGEVDQEALYLQVAASSTSAVILITPQFSNNNVDWYGYGQTGTTNVATTSATIYWTPSTTATSTQVFNLPFVPARHERVLIGASGANVAVYAEVTLKRLPTNP
jgi:hypothetical protein